MTSTRSPAHSPGTRRQPSGVPVKSAKGQATRDALRSAARKVIAQEGYLNAKIATIAETAGKSEASFYNYFDSKEDLLADLAVEFEQDLHALIREPFRAGVPAAEALRVAIGRYWQIFKERRGEVVGIFQASMVDEGFAAQWQEIRMSAVRRNARAIRRAQRDGFAPGLDPELAASALMSMLDYFAYVWLAQSGNAADGAFSDEQVVDTLWKLWYHAVYWTEPPDRDDENTLASPAE